MSMSRDVQRVRAGEAVFYGFLLGFGGGIILLPISQYGLQTLGPQAAERFILASLGLALIGGVVVPGLGSLESLWAWPLDFLATIIAIALGWTCLQVLGIQAWAGIGWALQIAAIAIGPIAAGRMLPN